MVYISVIIPVHNEGETLSILHKRLESVLKSIGKAYEIVYVNDGSTDNSSRILSRLSKKRSVIVLNFDKCRGQSYALSQGFSTAKGNYLITLDADMQNDPVDIPILINYANKKKFDLVCGWRFRRKDSFSRVLVSKLWNWCVRLSTGSSVHDHACTLRLYKKKVPHSIRYFDGYHRYIPVLARFNHFRVGEIKVLHSSRKHGKSKYPVIRIKALTDFFYVLHLIYFQKNKR